MLHFGVFCCCCNLKFFFAHVKFPKKKLRKGKEIPQEEKQKKFRKCVSQMITDKLAKLPYAMPCDVGVISNIYVKIIGIKDQKWVR